MDSENSEILRELDNTLPDTGTVIDNDPNNLSEDLDADLEKFGVPNDGFDKPEAMYGCEDTVEEPLEGGGAGLGCPGEDLARDDAETEESVMALLKQEKDEVQLSQDEFTTESLPNGQMQISGQESNGMSKQQECSGCKSNISDRFLLKALDQYWHEDCLKCSLCDCRLGEVGSTLFAKANLLLCRNDYLRLFGTKGYCSACSKDIPPMEMVMRVKSNVYHLECFACHMCNYRFCVGDRFYLCDNKILCEYDYEERMVFANMTYNYNALSQIKRQANSLSDDLSSGYGSPSPGSL